MGLPRSRAIARIRIHPTDPDRVYVAVQGAPYGRPTEERGIYRSRDGGATWDHVLYIGETAGASDLAMDPTNPRILYAAFWELLVPGIARLVTGRTLKQRTFVVHRAENRQKRLRLQAVALHPGTTIANYRFVLPATAPPHLADWLEPWRQLTERLPSRNFPRPPNRHASRGLLAPGCVLPLGPARPRSRPFFFRRKHSIYFDVAQTHGESLELLTECNKLPVGLDVLCDLLRVFPAQSLSDRLLPLPSGCRPNTAPA